MPYLSKADERTLMEKVGQLLLAHSAYTETYGVSAMLEQCQAWAQAIDSDMPMSCYQRDKAEADHAAKVATEKADMIVVNARKEAADIIKAADIKAQRIHAAVSERLYQVSKALAAL